VIERLARYVDHALDRGALGDALRAIPEVLVTRCILATGKNLSRGDWLEKSSRQRANIALFRADKKCRTLWPGDSSDEQRILTDVGLLRNRRNHYAHAGFKKMIVDLAAHLNDTKKQWASVRASLSNDAFWETIAVLQNEGAPDLVVTPLGLSPGVIFTLGMELGVAGAANARLIIVASPESSVGVPLALAALRERYIVFKGHLVVKADPVDWRASPSGEAWDQAEKWASEAATTWVNLTGGTTRLTYHAQTIGRRSHAAGAPVREVALVDTRSPSEQRSDPWVAGKRVDVRREDVDDRDG
jgi:hypothetical protein